MNVEKVTIPLIRVVVIVLGIGSGLFYAGTYLERVGNRMSTLEKQVDVLSSDVRTLVQRFAYK